VQCFDKLRALLRLFGCAAVATEAKAREFEGFGSKGRERGIGFASSNVSTCALIEAETR
jgi:hypothetical protein